VLLKSLLRGAPDPGQAEKQSSAVCETENRHRVEGAFDLRKVRSRFSDQPQKNGSGCRRMGEDPNARCLKKKHRSTCMTMLAQVGAYPCNQIRNTTPTTVRRDIYMRCGYGGKHKIHVPPSCYAGYVVGLGKLADES